jgi:hypothetical protein
MTISSPSRPRECCCGAYIWRARAEDVHIEFEVRRGPCDVLLQNCGSRRHASGPRRQWRRQRTSQGGCTARQAGTRVGRCGVGAKRRRCPDRSRSYAVWLTTCPAADDCVAVPDDE